MSILNELTSYLLDENATEMKPVSRDQPQKAIGQTQVSSSVASQYQNAIRDCKEHSSLDGTTEMIFDSLRKVDLMPFTEADQPWGGSYATELDVGEGGVAKLNLRENDKAVTNAYLKIDLYRNTNDEYEVASRIIVE